MCDQTNLKARSISERVCGGKSQVLLLLRTRTITST